MSKYFNISGIVILFLLCLCLLSFADETLTITTYYPSPYGRYNQLTTTGNTYLAITSGNVGIGTTNPTATLHIATGSIKFPDGTTQSTAPVPYVSNWSGAVPVGTTTVVSRTITGPAVVRVMWKALATNSAASGATFSFLYLDSAKVDNSGGLRNPSNAIVQWFDQTNSWAGVIPSGSHTISVQEYADLGSGTVNNGQLSIMVWGI